jgi:hypothetical protein
MVGLSTRYPNLEYIRDSTQNGIVSYVGIYEKLSGIAAGMSTFLELVDSFFTAHPQQSKHHQR